MVVITLSGKNNMTHTKEPLGHISSCCNYNVRFKDEQAYCVKCQKPCEHLKSALQAYFEKKNDSTESWEEKIRKEAVVWTKVDMEDMLENDQESEPFLHIEEAVDLFKELLQSRDREIVGWLKEMEKENDWRMIYDPHTDASVKVGIAAANGHYNRALSDLKDRIQNHENKS